MTSIKIVTYDDRWPSEFRTIGSSMRLALGERALRIDHIGSTSVPGLDAKDIIDVQITIASLDLRELLVPALEQIGYEQREAIAGDHLPPGAINDLREWEKLFFRSAVSQRPTNVHVRVHGRSNQRYALLFRDYLRTHPVAAEGYERVKQALARLHPDDIDAYLDVKDPVVDIIMDAAEDWARAVDWVLGPSDA